MQQFMATTNGTVATKRIPYRFLEKGQKIDLTDEEAEFYLKSSWLRPVAEVLGRPVPPIMSHMPKIVSRVAQPFQPQASSATQGEGYNANIRALQEREAREDGKPIVQAVAEQNAAAAESKIESTGGAAAQGTGNQDAF